MSSTFTFTVRTAPRGGDLLISPTDDAPRLALSVRDVGLFREVIVTLDVNGAAVTGIDLPVAVSPEVFELVDVLLGALLGESFLIGTQPTDHDTGVARLAIAHRSAPGPTAAGEAATVVLKVLIAGTDYELGASVMAVVEVPAAAIPRTPGT